jgi:hypothetical protein
MIITAAKKHGARGFGVDLDRRLVALSNRMAAKAGVADRAVFYERDIYQKLKPGTRVVSHDYDMGEWTPDLAFTMDAPGKPVGRDQKSKVFYWVVPARASGRWLWQSPAENGAPRAFELAIHQNFQHVEGTLSAEGRTVRIEEPKLVGDRLTFVAKLDTPSAMRYEFSGRIVNNALDGTVRVVRDGAAPREQTWNAARTELWEPRHFTLPPPTLVPPQ